MLGMTAAEREATKRRNIGRRQGIMLFLRDVSKIPTRAQVAEYCKLHESDVPVDTFAQIRTLIARGWVENVETESWSRLAITEKGRKALQPKKQTSRNSIASGGFCSNPRTYGPRSWQCGCPTASGTTCRFLGGDFCAMDRSP